MAVKLPKNLFAKFENRNLLLKSLIGIIGLMSLLLAACILYIVQGNVRARTRYSVKTFSPQGEVPQWVDVSITFSEAVIDKSRVGTEVPAEALRFTPSGPRFCPLDRAGQSRLLFRRTFSTLRTIHCSTHPRTQPL